MCEEKYARDNPVKKTCINCGDNTKYYVTTGLAIVAGIIFIILMIRNDLKEA